MYLSILKLGKYVSIYKLFKFKFFNFSEIHKYAIKMK